MPVPGTASLGLRMSAAGTLSAATAKSTELELVSLLQGEIHTQWARHQTPKAQTVAEEAQYDGKRLHQQRQSGFWYPGRQGGINCALSVDDAGDGLAPASSRRCRA
jgi:hypothetical protein